MLVVGEGLESLSFGLILPYLALYLTDTIGASAGEAGVVLALWSLVALGATPLGGVLSDRVGRRPVMLGALAGSALAAIAFGFATTVWVAGALVVVWALFSSAFDPTSSAYVSDVVEPELRTEGFGLQRVVANAAFALGPPLGALLIWLASVRAAFVVSGAVLVAYLVVVWRWLPESRPTRPEGSVPVRFRDALRDRLLLILAAGTALAATSHSLYEGVVPVFLNDERAVEIATWGLLFGINPILIALFQYPVSRWASRRSNRGVLAAGALLQGVSLVLVLPVEGTAAILLAVVVFTIGEMLFVPVALALAAELAPVHLRGSYQGSLTLAWEVAWGPTTLLGLWLVGNGQGELALAAALPAGVLGALLFFTLPREPSAREPVLAQVPVVP